MFLNCMGYVVIYVVSNCVNLKWNKTQLFKNLECIILGLFAWSTES